MTCSNLLADCHPNRNVHLSAVLVYFLFFTSFGEKIIRQNSRKVILNSQFFKCGSPELIVQFCSSFLVAFFMFVIPSYLRLWSEYLLAHSNKVRYSYGVWYRCSIPGMHNIRPSGQMWPTEAFSLFFYENILCLCKDLQDLALEHSKTIFSPPCDLSCVTLL